MLETRTGHVIYYRQERGLAYFFNVLLQPESGNRLTHLPH